MTRTVADAAVLLGVLAGQSYAGGLEPARCRGAARRAAEPADLARRGGGLPVAPSRCCATRRRTVEVPELPETDEMPVLHYEFARDVDAYLARLPATHRSGPWPSSQRGTTRMRRQP